LAQLHRKSLLECVIENRITRGVSKIGENDCVLVGKFPGSVKITVTASGKRHNDKSSGNDDFPRYSALLVRTNCCACWSW
jgi:hypothetical protein